MASSNGQQHSPPSPPRAAGTVAVDDGGPRVSRWQARVVPHWPEGKIELYTTIPWNN
jgi:hypothetical protein